MMRSRSDTRSEIARHPTTIIVVFQEGVGSELLTYAWLGYLQCINMPPTNDMSQKSGLMHGH